MAAMEKKYVLNIMSLFMHL